MKVTKYFFLKKIIRFVFCFRRPLVDSPTALGQPISDLFIWRRSNKWETCFELFDLASLFRASTQDGNIVKFIFFDFEGNFLQEHTVEITPNTRIIVNISKILSRCSVEFGTFCVFHLQIPEIINLSDSYLSERGYVSYRYLNGPLRGYVHGNLDAVSLKETGQIELLGGFSCLKRKYELQYVFRGGSDYELAIVNPSGGLQRIVFDVVSEAGHKVHSEAIKLNPRGVGIFRLQHKFHGYRVVIRSRLVMARPVVFRTRMMGMDVFHG